MSYKYFGRLAGGSNAGDSLSQTADNNTTTPYSAQRPATKFMAFGESATSLNMNRALAALSANSDYLSSVLDTPSLRKDVLTPVRDNGVGSTQSGFSALTSIGFGATDFNLALANSPVVWVYVGLHKDSLSKTLRAYRVKSGEYIDGAYPDIAEMDMLHITDVKINSSSATSYFDGQAGTYVGTPELALAEKVPGITLVQTGLAPYSGNPETVNIASWDEDGPKIGDVGTPMSWADIYARPGCFVLVSGETGVTTNNGLYRISSISGTTAGTAGDKAILTRGGLHKVTVADATNFDVGRRVAWRSSPNHAATSTKAQRENTAYVMFKVGNDLYLSSFSSPEDFGIQGTAVGYRITDDASKHGPVHRTGSVGLADQEESADQNWSLPLGTLLYNNDTGDNSAVTAVIPSGYPVKFATNSNVGNIQLCAPPGFLLNPLLEVDGTKALNGDYYIHCHTLTTNREKLLSPGQSANRFTYESSADRLVSTEGDESRHKAFAKFLRVGYEDPSDVGSKVHPASYGATKQILGEGLWKVSIDDEGNTKDITTSGLVVGQSIGWKHPSFLLNTQSQTTSTVVDFGVEGGTQYLILKDVENAGWEALNVHIENDPLIGGNFPNSSFTTIGADDYYISSVIYGPYLKDDLGNEYVPSFGLNAAYHNHYDASKNARGTRGLGNVISSIDGRPLTVILPLGSTNPGLAVRTVDSGAPGSYDLISLLSRGGTALATVGYTSDSITFEDTNTGADIAFSDADHTSLPLQHASVLASLEASHLGGQNFSAFSSGVMHFGGVTINTLDASLGESYYHYKGAKIKVPATTVAADLSITDGLLFYKPSNDSYVIEQLTSFNLGDQDKVLVARLIHDGVQINTFSFCGYSINRVDQRTDILIGVMDSDTSEVYTNNVAHFPTLGEAFVAIDAWNAADGTPDRHYTLTVVGDTTEAADALKGISLPLAVPPNQQITIKGAQNRVGSLADSSNKNPVVSWSSLGRLMDIDQTRGLTIENLTTKWTGSLPSSSSTVPVVAPYYSTGTAGSDKTDLVTFRGCCHFGGEAFLVMPSLQAEKVILRDCHSLSAGAGLHFQSGTFSENSKLIVDNCVFEMYADGVDNYRNEGPFAAAVYVGAAGTVFDHISITNSLIQSAGTDGFHRGVHIHTPGSTVLISDNVFEHIGDTVANYSSTTNGGVRIENTALVSSVPLVTIRNNKFINLAVNTGVYINSTGHYEIIGNLFKGAFTPASGTKSGDYTIEMTALLNSAQIKHNVLEDTRGYAVKAFSEDTQIHGNRINVKGNLSASGLIDISAENVDVTGNYISLSDAAALCSSAINVADNAYINISDNFIKNTRTPGTPGVPNLFNVDFYQSSAYVQVHGNTILGNDGGWIDTDLSAGQHIHWSVKGNEISGNIRIRSLLDSHIKDNTLHNLILDAGGGPSPPLNVISNRVVVESNVLYEIDADEGGHILQDSIVSNNVLEVSSTSEGIDLGTDAAGTTEGVGNTVSGNIFSNAAGVINTGVGSSVTNNVNVSSIQTGPQNTSASVPSVVTDNKGSSLEIFSYGGSTVSSNTGVVSIKVGSGSTVSDNRFRAATVTSFIEVFGNNSSVTGNRKGGADPLEIRVGLTHSTPISYINADNSVVSGNHTNGGDIIIGGTTVSAHNSVISGNVTEGGDIKVSGNSCVINNNNLGFISGVTLDAPGVGSLHVGLGERDPSSGAITQEGGKNCNITGNLMPGGTIYLLKGQNVLVANMLIYMEATSVTNSKIADNITDDQTTPNLNAKGAIIIDALAQYNVGTFLGEYHNNVFIGNMYRGGGTSSEFGPHVQIDVGSSQTRPFLGGDGDLDGGEDLTHIHDGGVQRRLNLEE